MSERRNERTIISVDVVHKPNVSIDTGLRRLTLEHARVEVSVALSDGSTEQFAVIRTPQRGVRKQTKIDMALHGFEPIKGMQWGEVQRIALHFQFLPLGIPWGIRYSGESRWFHCFCDGKTKIAKDEWRKYSAGEPISVTCDHCTLTQVVQKGNEQPVQ